MTHLLVVLGGLLFGGLTVLVPVVLGADLELLGTRPRSSAQRKHYTA